jgi:hypothetical protein
MPLGIRGSNPIWVEVDLTGKVFDSTYYMWVLQNTIPYIPAAVYQDPDLNVLWTDPIQFLANGTLPNNVYFLPDTVYRLEFRQNNGLAPPSQNDPLIYLVENYVPGSGGSTPVDTVASTSENQITNPQFALINFASPYTYSGAAGSLPVPGTIHVAPGWFLDLAGTGTVTLTQVPLNSTTPNPSNAPYALRITLLGWDTAVLRQRFQQNGLLWANKYVASTITARIQGSPQAINANLYDSQNNLLTNVLSNVTIDATFNEFTGHGLLPASTDTDTPPAAYIDYRLSLPTSADIYVTSIQLSVQDLPIEPSFEQDSINRQIDHTYNKAYPIVPVGTVIDYGGFGVPEHYLACDGTAYSRITYNLLYQAMTHAEMVTLNSSTSFTVANGAIYRIGMPVEGTGIPASTTVSNVSGNTITISNAATITGSSTVRFFAAGNGDGSTTFNVYDTRDYVVAGLGGSLFGAANNGLGAKGGAATHILTVAELPNPIATGVGVTNVTASGTVSVIRDNATGSGVISNPTGGNAMSLVQQTILLNKCIRFE